MKQIAGKWYYTAEDALASGYELLPEPSCADMPTHGRVETLCRKYDVTSDSIAALRFADDDWKLYLKPNAVRGSLMQTEGK